MLDQDKSKQELIEELAEVRRRVAVLETGDTDRKQAEQALQESEERFRKVLEEGPIGILLVGTDGSIQHVNRHFREMLGYSEDEIIALGLAGISQPDNWKRDHAFVSRLWRGESSHYQTEKRYLHKDGRVVWGQLTVSLMHDRAGRPINTVGMVEEISERKQAEDALRLSEAKYRRLHQSMMDAFISVDMDGFIREYNEAYRTMLGYEPEELLQLRYQDLTPEKWHSYEAEIVQKQILSLGHSEIYEKEYRRKDGTVFPVELRAFLIKDDHGEPSTIWGIVRDITERKRVEEALRKAHDELEQRVKERTAELAKANENLEIFRKFAEDSEEGFGMSEFDGRIVYANSKLCRLFGEEKPEDVIGRNVSKYYSDEYAQRRKEELIPALLREGHLHIEETVLPRHGKPIQTLQSTFLIRDEGGIPSRIAVVISDITERKRVEEALRASEERFRVAFEEAPLGIVMVVGDGIVVRVNRTFCQMSRYTEEELIGNPLGGVTYPEDRERSGELTRRVLAGLLPSFVVEKRYLRKGGGFFWGQLAVTAVHDRGGNVIFALGIIENITDRKQAEEALRRSEKQLAERTALAEWRASQLQRLAADLTEAEERERHRLSQVLHDDLQQLLVAAKLHVGTTQEMLQDDRLAAGLVQIQSLLSEAIGASRSLTTELSPPILYEHGLVAALEWLGWQSQEKFQLATSVEADPKADLKGEAVGVFVFHAVRELILNAAKHGRATHVAIRLSHVDEDHIRLMVTDDGVGCDPERLNPRRDSGGFGLFSIRERLDLIGGSLEITSQPGEGTTVTITVPSKMAHSNRSRLASGQMASPDLSSANGGTRIRVLLVDDHPIYRKGLADMLLGQPTIDMIGEADDGHEAVEMAIELRPNVILMDVSMPRMDGIEATRRIKEAAPAIRIIGLSMHEKGEMERSMRNAGADHYLVKTAAAEDLIAAILKQCPRPPVAPRDEDA